MDEVRNLLRLWGVVRIGYGEMALFTIAGLGFNLLGTLTWLRSRLLMRV